MTDDNTTASSAGSEGGAAGLARAGRETIEGMRTKAMDMASRTAEAARSEALTRGEAAKDGLAGAAERLARSLRGAADGPEATVQSRLMAAAADTIEDLSGTLRGRPLGELLGEAEAFARRNPGAFVAAAAVVGFAMARFARASSSDDDAQQGGVQGASPYGQGPAGASWQGGAARGGVSTTGMSTHDDDGDDDAGARSLSGTDRTLP